MKPIEVLFTFRRVGGGNKSKVIDEDIFGVASAVAGYEGGSTEVDFRTQPMARS